MIRIFMLTQDGKLLVSDNGWREPTVEECDAVSDAIPGRRLPWWVEWGTVGLVLIAAAFFLPQVHR
jgi:hypothetical protein